MRPAWVQHLLRSLLLLQGLWALLSSVSFSHSPPGWRFTYYEVVIPRKVPHRQSGTGRTDQLSYSMRFQGRRHTVHMKVKKSLLPRDFPVITDNDQGAMQEDYPFVPRDCYYLSYLEGVPGSMATLDTCSGGLRGMLQVDDLTYEIKPLETSSKFEHVISQLVSEEQLKEAEMCTIEEKDLNQAFEEEKRAETPRAGSVYLWVPHMKSLKIHYTVSHSLYLQNSNFSSIVENIVIMNNILDSIFQHVHLNVYIRVLCIWNSSDLVSLTHVSAYSALITFGMWKKNWYGEINHDVSLLLTGHSIGGTYYYAFQNGLCNPNWGASYVFVPKYHLFMASSISAHALGHNMDIKHDMEYCYCFRRSSCVMAPMPSFQDTLSNCSYGGVFTKISGWDPCLSDSYAPYKNFPYIAPRCGNKIVDEGEECDCGSFKECSEEKCCLTNCLLSLGSVCSSGDCCLRCKYSPPGTICRDIRGICDLPEYCDGKAHKCPHDFYVQDGTPCSPLAVCVKGNCSDRDMQCQSLFGYQVRDASPACYEKLNKIGDRFGNCGTGVISGGGSSIRCEEDDVFCGMLHCTGIKYIPGIGEHSTFRHLLVRSVKMESCFGYDAHFASGKPHMGLVVDGATCGPGRYCLDKNCTYFQDLPFTCNVSKCHHRGVCNNRDNCHCLHGWKPPFCAEVGPGGSIDSGPPSTKESELRASILLNVNVVAVIISARLALFLGSFLVGFFSKLKQTMEPQNTAKPKQPWSSGKL